MSLRPPRARRSRVAAAGLLGVLSPWTLAAEPASLALQPFTTAAFANALAIALALAGAVLVAAALLSWRLLRSRQRLAEALREARARSSCLEPLFDAWLWQTDAAHRLVSARPPPDAPAAAWGTLPEPVPLWDCFEADDPAALRAQLAAAAALDDLPVRLVGPGTAPRPGLLRGRPHRDAIGGFAGYHGSFRELVPASGAVAVAPLVEIPAPAAASASETKTEPGSAPAIATPATPATPARPAMPAAAEQESFSFTVSHDLRAPIRVVEGFTKIIKEDYGHLLDRVGNDHLDRVLGAAARMNNMVDALLALSKLASQPLTQHPVNLSQLAGYVVDDLRRQAPERAVQIVIEPGLQVLGDPTLLRVVVENLLGNAWKYTGKAAQASIAFERDAGAPDTFTVRDNGAGFDMRFADRLFGVFQRLHSVNDFPGTGVGLASVRRIVRRHGGEIWGEAEVNRGARFHFSLPQRGAAAADAQPSPNGVEAR